MAGVKKFDQEEIIDRALEVFWQQGYEATSIHDLVEATGIGSGSLYGTFGDQEKLFLAVLDRYSEKSAATFMNALNDPNPRRALEGMFEQLIERMSNPGYPRGCLTTNTCVESPGGDEVIARKVAEKIAGMESVIYQVLLRAQAEGSLAPGRDIRALALFFAGTVRRIAVMNKASADPSVIRDIAKVALSVWDEQATSCNFRNPL